MQNSFIGCVCLENFKYGFKLSFNLILLRFQQICLKHYCVRCMEVCIEMCDVKILHSKILLFLRNHNNKYYYVCALKKSKISQRPRTSYERPTTFFKKLFKAYKWSNNMAQNKLLAIKKICPQYIIVS